MARHLRSLAREWLGVMRPRTYYLPWITRPGLECALVLSNVEARFKPEFSAGPFPATVVQYDGHDYTATHGREEFIEGYPGLIRLLMKAACAMVSVLGRTVPIFTRNQYVYLGSESRS